MPSESIREVLREWVSREVIIVDPESLQRNGPRDTVSFETYSARIRAVQSDFVQVSFQSQNRGTIETVEEFIPLGRVKRLTVRGEELHLHL